ncbi:arylsulfatase B-like [Clytia hemisphaerica]|uniref:Sulfatase N-terminal domain-containing protein n=1 Tax=Clytia hemisphaerica TaxID=252671 RepID=A0A7M5VG07_9CNID
MEVFSLMLTLLLVSCLQFAFVESEQPPNVVFILADDLGWNDVGFHGSDQIETPNIDKLAKEGIILNNYYVQPICCPTRSALMTGRYPIHTGMYHSVIRPEEPWGLSLDEKMLPQYLKEQGYTTHMVGKWHLGYFAKEYTPTYRGFDTFYGYYNGAEDYFYHNRSGYHFPQYSGVDLHHAVHEQMTHDWFQDGHYSGDLFTSKAIDIIQDHPTTDPLFLYLPFQNVHDPWDAPKEWVDKFSNKIEDEQRRTFAAMVGALDEAIGKIYEALDEKNMLDNSIIIFTSDNGGIPTDGHSSNFPLRGQKWNAYEGGVRVPAFINSPLLKRSGVTSMQMMHVTDWLPTIVNLAQGKITKEIDGFDQWKTLQSDVESPRKEILLNIDDIFNQEALIVGEWKILTDFVHRSTRKKDTIDHGYQDGWIKAPGHNSTGKATSPVNCGSKPEKVTHCIETHCLFNLQNDPCEYNDVSSQYPEIYQQMKNKLEDYKKGMVQSRKQPGDKMSDPQLNGGFWGPWKEL